MKTAKNTKTAVFHVPIDRRRFFQSMALASAGFTLTGYLAEALTSSPIVTQGPYYPLANNIPLDKDNDLVQLNDNLTIASGIVSYISGRVLDSSGNPVRGALVELWHADREGDYLYSTSAARNPACDANFAGFGQFLTGSSGRFLFRTSLLPSGLDTVLPYLNGLSMHLLAGVVGVVGSKRCTVMLDIQHAFHIQLAASKVQAVKGSASARARTQAPTWVGAARVRVDRNTLLGLVDGGRLVGILLRLDLEIVKVHGSPSSSMARSRPARCRTRRCAP